MTYLHDSYWPLRADIKLIIFNIVRLKTAIILMLKTRPFSSSVGPENYSNKVAANDGS